ncbi:MAG TPA: hypothetical protein VGO43_08020 [Pyrinomonadaceae bacterium]|jgi:hypothetical protein|nr:hypothetical protein [Pyrinomonadaceae bacterium]
MPYLPDNIGSAYDSALGRDGLSKTERVRIAVALRDFEKRKAELSLRAEVRRMERRGHSPKRIAKWLRLTVETVEEYLAG